MNLVSLEEVKRHLRITDDEDDGYLRFVINTATLQAEHFICDPSLNYTEDTCPEDIKYAILIECGNIYDMQRSSYTLQNAKKSDLFERVLMFHKKIFW